MQIDLLIVCSDESLSLSLSQSQHVAQEQANGIVSQTTDLANLSDRIAAVQPDVLLLQHSACDNARDVLRRVHQLSPATRILLLCESCSHDLMVAFIKLGVSGCLCTSDVPALVVKAVRSVHAGETWFGRSALLQALQSLIGPNAASPAPIDEGKLTHREEQIFQLIGRALTNKEIARQLDISDYTVKTHLHRIYVKLHQSGRYKAVLSRPNGASPW